jgi:hypothetical protein
LSLRDKLKFVGQHVALSSNKAARRRIRIKNTNKDREMFRIKASYTGQLELKTTLERAREFFGDFKNFADLMPGIEGIRKESGGIARWIVRAEVPVIGSVQASFAVRKT